MAIYVTKAPQFKPLYSHNPWFSWFDINYVLRFVT